MQLLSFRQHISTIDSRTLICQQGTSTRVFYDPTYYLRLNSHCFDNIYLPLLRQCLSTRRCGRRHFFITEYQYLRWDTNSLRCSTALVQNDIQLIIKGKRRVGWSGHDLLPDFATTNEKTEENPFFAKKLNVFIAHTASISISCNP